MAATRPLSRNYPRRSIQSPRQSSRKLISKHLWSSTPSNHHHKKKSSSRSRSTRTMNKKKQKNWNADFPMPSRYSEIGGHERNRPISRGTYQQADFGHLVPPPPPPPPSSSSSPAAAAATTTVPEVIITTAAIGSTDTIQQQREQQQQREPGQSIIVRRPMSPFMPYKKRTSEERQKLALTKLRSLYDGRTFYKKLEKKKKKNVVFLDTRTSLKY